MQQIPAIVAGVPFAPHPQNVPHPAGAAVADNLISQSAQALMALPAPLRASLPLCRDTFESTARALAALTHPHGLPAELAVRREQLTTAFNRLAQALHAAEQPHDLPLEHAIETAIRLLRKCENRVEYECDIHQTGLALRNQARDADTLLFAAEAAWRASEQRRQPVVPGGAPIAMHFIAPLTPAQHATLETATAEALAANNLNSMLQPLARISMTLANTLGAGSDFASWFSARALLEARQVSAVGLNGELINSLRQLDGGTLLTWEAGLANQVTYLSRNSADIASFVTSLIYQNGHAGHLNDLVALQLPRLPPLNPQADPQHVDPAWDEAVTPPGSPQH